MLNVNELEIRHKKYKRKLYTPYFKISMLIVAVVALISVFYYNYYSGIKPEVNKQAVKQPLIVEKNEVKPLKIKTEENNTTDKKINSEVVIAQKGEQKIEPKEESTIKQKRVILSPSLDFMHNIKSENLAYYRDEKSSEPKKRQKKELVKKKHKVVKKIEKRKKAAITADKKSSINIQRKDDEKDIKDVIKRFKTNHNPALSLFVAKKYYKLGVYDKAYNYALLTNEINNNIEASWIIFSQSLVKMNKKDKAIKTLKEYIAYSNSSRAKQLLDEILSGKFK